MTMDNPFGTDWSTFVDGVPDLDPTFSTLSNPDRTLAEVLARRLITRRGAIEEDPEFGTDVRQWCQARMGPVALAKIKFAVEAECLKEERVTSVTATVTFDPGLSKTRIVISGTADRRDFELTLLADQLTVELLNTPG